jgi:hypothetical protein
MSQSKWIPWALLALMSVGCDAASKSNTEAKAEAAEDEDDEPKKKKKSKKDDAEEAPKEKPAAEASAAAKGDAPPTTSGAAPSPMPVLPGRSPVPTLEEWNAVTKEVNVKGSSALQCETKMLREWLRVSCRGKNDTGGTPVSVITQKGGFGAYLFASGGVTSIVLPFVEGIDATFLFSWTDKVHPLHLKWPHRSPMPIILGEFEGARSPLDGTGLDPAICAKCPGEFRKRNPGSLYQPVCEEFASNPHCVATYGGDCDALLECTRGEPARPVRCASDAIMIFTNQCAKKCGPGRACPSGKVCADNVAQEPICIDP